MLIGSSYVKHLQREIEKSGTTPNFPLPLRMIGVSGLLLSELPGLLRKKLHPEGSGALIIQVGGNDIGNVTEFRWQELLNDVVSTCLNFPGYKIFWSDMMPRLTWRHCRDPQAGRMHKLRLQRRARALFHRRGGFVIKHPSININMLLGDGVHLTPEGNAFFLASLEAALNA